MELLTERQAMEWCVERGFRVGDGPPDRAGFEGVHASRFRIRVPEEATAAIALSYMVLLTEVADYEESNFEGAMVWLRRWQVWSESIDRVGYKLLDGVTGSGTEDGWLNDTPAFVFTGNELVPAHACLSVPMLFQWDAYFLPMGAGFLVFVSHHGYLHIAAREEARAPLLERFREWSPEDDQ